VGLAGQSLAAQGSSPPRMFLAWAVPTLVWLAAHYLGDYLDRDLDATSKPHRPIPSGALSPRAACTAGAALAVAACVLAVTANRLTGVVLAVGIVAALAYNAVLKARGVWGNAGRGAVTAVAFLFGTMMSVRTPPVALLPIAFALWAHDAATNIVGTLRDVEGDGAAGYRTFAVQHGVRPAATLATALYGVAVATTAAAAGVSPHERTAYLGGILLAAVVGCVAFSLVHVPGEALTARTALWAHEVLVVERLLLVGALLVPGWGPAAASAAVAAMIAVTVVTQHIMRSRHEFPAGPPGARLARIGGP
jgi:geranylgeranylglycerol-phosphate geranylgeranyltransferase